MEYFFSFDKIDFIKAPAAVSGESIKKESNEEEKKVEKE